MPRPTPAIPLSLDVNTLLALMLANVFALAVAVPVVMGWRVSASARWVIGSAVSQALAWGSFLLARPVHDRLFSTLWIALLGASFLCMWRAVRGWVGWRPGRRLLQGVAIALPLGYGLGFEHYAFRVGWSNLGLAVLMTGVCVACAAPSAQASRRWRGLIVVSLGSLAMITLSRGILGAFFTEMYPALRAPHPINIAGALLNHIALTLTTLALLAGWHEEAERALREQADTDGLTGLLNRRAWRRRADDAWAVARRYGEPLALLMIDIDHFKQINDRGGHEAGDRALRIVSSVLQEQARRGDLVARWGGEEFCLLLLRADVTAGHEVDRRLRAALHAVERREDERSLHFSAGLAVMRPQDQDLDDVLRRADLALYQAKEAGRDRLVSAEPRPVVTPAPRPRAKAPVTA